MQELTQLFGILIGLLFTTLPAFGCKCFLQKTVKVELPSHYDFLKNLDSGGRQLGFLESWLFFFSSWSHEPLIAGGWLTFKLGAKWASWQHVIKIPEGRIEENVREDINFRVRFGTMQLGRFLNGTMDNAFCGLIGYVIGQASINFGLVRFLIDKL